MEQLAAALRDVELVVFGLLALVAVWQWQRRGGRSAAWLAATFASLGLVLVLGRLTPDDTAPLWLARAQVLLLTFFPYSLYRFARTFVPSIATVGVIVHLLLAAVVVWTVGFLDMEAQGSGALRAFTYLFLVYWTALFVVTAIRLWRAGQRQPNVVRNRMRLLAAGAVAMNVALLLAVFAAPGAEDPASASDVAVAAVVLLAGGLFYVGFAPPGVLRAAWRRPAERALRDAQLALVSSVRAGDVADALLPFVQRVFGGEGAALVTRAGEVLAATGFGGERAARLGASLVDGVDPPPDVVVIELRSGWLALRVEAVTPYFGQDELELLEVLGSFIDLALERADLHESERAAREAVERTNAELEALVYGISHDLKNPIITLLGYVDLVRADYGDRLDAEGRHFLDRMAVSAAYMEQLLTDLLELSRVGRMQTEPAPVALGPLVDDVAQEVRRDHPQASVVVGTLPTIMVNPVRARQLFTNLVENAARHSGRRDVTITISSRTDDDGGAVVTVADDGRGIPVEYRDRVFGIFERLDDGGATTEGTGIGLAICRRITETFAGSIEIGDEGPGATFVIRVPADAVVATPQPAM